MAVVPRVGRGSCCWAVDSKVALAMPPAWHHLLFVVKSSIGSRVFWGATLPERLFFLEVIPGLSWVKHRAEWKL